MTNPDNVGGLLPEPAAFLERTWRGSWFVASARLDSGIAEIPVYTADQMRAYGELCRAAPAGGDVPSWRNVGSAIDAKALATATEIALMWGNDRSQFVSRIQVAVIDAMRWMGDAQNPVSAPAGSAEVDEDIDGLCRSLEFMAEHSDSVGFNSDAECLRTAAALLRKLQQGAE